MLVFPFDDRFAVLSFFWVPEDGARRRERRDRVPYLQWIREDHIEATPGEVIDSHPRFTIRRASVPGRGFW